MNHNPFAGASVEHVCLPSTSPRLTAEFLVKLGGEITQEIPDGPIFCSFGKQLFELNSARTSELPPGKLCHIATGFQSPEEYAAALDYMRSHFGVSDILFGTTTDGTELKYTLLEVPGGVTLQLIWRAKPLRRAQEPPPGGDNPEC